MELEVLKHILCSVHPQKCLIFYHFLHEYLNGLKEVQAMRFSKIVPNNTFSPSCAVAFKNWLVELSTQKFGLQAQEISFVVNPVRGEEQEHVVIWFNL